MDHEVGRLLQGLRDLNLYDRATLVVTADHGESFGEEGRWMLHGDSVAEGESRVPLIVKFHPNLARGTRWRTPVALADLYTTLLAEAGLESRVPHASNRNLRSVAEGLSTDQHPPLTTHKDTQNVSWLVAVHGTECTARWRISRNSEAQAGRAKGPGEMMNWSVADAAHWLDFATREDPHLRAGSPACEAALARQADAAIADHLSYRRNFEVTLRFVPTDGSRAQFVKERNDPSIPLDPAEVDQLRALGYIED